MERVKRTMEQWHTRRNFYTDTVDLSPEDHRVKVNGVLYPALQVSVMWMRTDGAWDDNPGCAVTLATLRRATLSSAELDDIPPWLENIIETSRPKGD